MAKELSVSKCILLTVHFASEGNVKALHSFTPSRPDALDPELVLRILLTYLPESIEPKEYTTYVSEVASRLYLDVEREEVEVDSSPVKDLDDEQARKRVKKLNLLAIKAPTYPPHAPEDLLIRFVCHRAYRIDSETGLLNLVPSLVEPFLERGDYIRTWYIGIVLPLLRLEFEYYPEYESLAMSLNDFEKVDGREGVDFLLKRASEAAPGEEPQLTATDASKIARDIKGLVGPWMYGHTERKRRKLEVVSERPDNGGSLALGVRKIALEGVGAEHKTEHDWEYMFRWMVFQSRENFPLITRAIEEWRGPGDVDLGGLTPGNSDQYIDADTQRKLDAQFAQAAFASCYAVSADTDKTIEGAHCILARLAEILDFIPPPDLATSVDSLPRIERHALSLDKSQTVADLEPDALLKPEHPLTTPRFETYMLLQMIIYSAYQFSGLGYPLSLLNVAKLHFYATPNEQLAVMQKILRGLSKSGARKDETQWTADREKLIWLWNWGIDVDDENSTTGPGVLGKIERKDFEKEMLKCFTETSCYDLAINLYLRSIHTALSAEQVEEVVLNKAMEVYDGASNGNKTRGGMKKANDILLAFRPHLPQSRRFRQAMSLISATHALSFYSLTLQHGVPFQPVSIRVNSDPIGLIDKVLEQNPKSYTLLDDLVEVGRNLVSAGLPQKDENVEAHHAELNEEEVLQKSRKDAERRVTFMAVEAALREDDFETAYSYIVNRLTPSGADLSVSKDARTGHIRNTSTASRTSQSEIDDDISWRAAFLAGRYRPSTAPPPTLRLLEQRTELLSLALLLAPLSALTEILVVWRRCEEEYMSLQTSQQQAEHEFDDRADKRQSTSSLPGNFTVHGDGQPPMVFNQKRREMGRLTGKAAGENEAPMSMFDLTRNAAQAFSRNAWTGRPTAAGLQHDANVGENFDDGEGEYRVRKRDMVANAASGALASGLGWVLGAKPVSKGQEE